MDRISDSGSDGYGSNPYGGTGDGGSAPITKKGAQTSAFLFPLFAGGYLHQRSTQPNSSSCQSTEF